MFFSLTRTAQNNFPKHYKLPNGLMLNADDGWQVYNAKKHIIFKGYANNFASHHLVEQLIDQQDPCVKGNFCAFVSDAYTTKLMHDTNRSFPLWIDDNTITNLNPLDQQIWADCLLTIDQNFAIDKQWYKPYHKNTQQLTDDQIINQVHETIQETYEQFLTHNTKPIKIFLSGGLDTITSWAYLDKFTKNYEIVDYEYMKYTNFYKRNCSSVREHWGYKQIHLWDHDCVLVTGGNGDENFLRGPNTLGMALKHHGLTFKDILEPNDYHYWYLSKKDITDSINAWYNDCDDVEDWILNRNINDHQHWHIDQTITFTPFKDISILACILTASKNLLVAQAKHGEINRQLIKKLDADKITKISTQKNLNPMEHV